MKQSSKDVNDELFLLTKENNNSFNSDNAANDKPEENGNDDFFLDKDKKNNFKLKNVKKSKDRLKNGSGFNIESDGLNDKLFGLINKLKAVNCLQNEAGYKLVRQNFFYCITCDPEEREPICKACSGVCHTGHKLSQPQILSSNCNCGIKNHNVSIANREITVSSSECKFFDWCASSKRNVLLKNVYNETVCYFCFMFCMDPLTALESKSEMEELTSKSIQENNNSSDQLNEIKLSIKKKPLNSNISTCCECTKSTHQDFKKLTYCLQTLKSQNLDHLNANLKQGFSSCQLLNTILKSQVSFQYTFETLTIAINKIKEKIDLKEYFLDSATLNIVHRGLSCFDFFMNDIYENFFISSVIDKLVFSEDFFLDFMLSPLQPRSATFFIISEKITKFYNCFDFKRKYSRLPEIKIEDLLNLNPIIRITTLNNYSELLNSDENYFKIYVTKLLLIVNSLIKNESPNQYILSTLGIIFEMIHTLASLNIIFENQKIKFCIVVEEVIFFFLNKISTLDVMSSFNLDIMSKILGMVKTIEQIIFFFVVYLNDESVASILMSTLTESENFITQIHVEKPAQADDKKKSDLPNFEFYHASLNDNELIKIINKININILGFLSEFKVKTLSLYSDCISLSCSLQTLILNNYEAYLNSFRMILNEGTAISFTYCALTNFSLYSDIRTGESDEFAEGGQTSRINNNKRLSQTQENFANKNIQAKMSFIEMLNKEETNLRKSYSKYYMNSIDFDALEQEVTSNLIRVLGYLKINDLKSIKLNSKKEAHVAEILMKYTECLESSQDPSQISQRPKIFESLENTLTITENIKSNFMFMQLIDIPSLRDYQACFNKSFYLHFLMKFLSIKIEYDKIEKSKSNTVCIQVNNIESDYINPPKKEENLLPKVIEDKILNILIFYCINNINNIQNFLQGSILQELACITNPDFTHFFIYLISALNESKIKLTSTQSIIAYIKQKIPTTKVEVLITIIQSIFELETFDENWKLDEIMEILKMVNYKYFDESNISELFNLDLYVATSKYKVNSSKHLTSTISDNNINHEEIANFNFFNIISSLGKKELYFNYLSLINKVFDGNALFNETVFLTKVLNLKQIRLILSVMDLNILYRIELLKFMRMAYVDVIVDTKRVKDYRAILMNEHESFKMTHPDDASNLLTKDLLTVNKSMENLKTEIDIIKEEMLRFQEVISGNVEGSTEQNIYAYFNEGILLPLYVLAKKFISILHLLTGHEYIDLFEITIYFIKLKVFLITGQRNLKRKFNSKQKEKEINEVNEANTEEQEKPQRQSLFKKTKFMANFKKKEAPYVFNDKTMKSMIQQTKLITKKLSANDLQTAQRDLEIMSQEDFIVFDFLAVYKILEIHIFSFLGKQENESLIELFEKKQTKYFTRDDIKSATISFGINSQTNTEPNKTEGQETKENKIHMIEEATEEFENRSLNALIIYENLKCKLSSSSFFEYLAEKNLYFDTNYRQLLLKSLIFLATESLIPVNYQSESYFHLFKMLQNDTSNSQYEIQRLYDEETLHKKMLVLIDVFTMNAISVIFAACNPCISTTNKDYYISLNIIKIFKYLCEEHNNYFQTMCFSSINLEEKKEDEIPKRNANQRTSVKTGTMSYYNMKSFTFLKKDKICVINDNDSPINENMKSIKIFDFFLYILSKIIILSKWDRINDDQAPYVKPQTQPQSRDTSAIINKETANKKLISKLKIQQEILNESFNKVADLSKKEDPSFIPEEVLEDINKSNSNFYYFDLFFALLELCIEMVQGNTKSNLETIIAENMNDKNPFNYLLNTMQPLLFNQGSHSEISFKIRISVMDFVLTFIEEKATPKKAIDIISNNFSPSSIFECLKSSMKHLNKKIKEEKKIQDSSEIFNDKSKDLFFQLYLTENLNNPEFEFANKLFIYIKLLGEEFNNLEAQEILKIESKYKENEMAKLYMSMKNQRSKSSANIHMNSLNSLMVTEELVEWYYIVSFMNSITKTLFVQRDGEISRVIIRLNPITYYISDTTKTDFKEKVDRSKRYTKLFGLTESIDEFDQEAQFNYKRSKNKNYLTSLGKIDFKFFEFLVFIILLVINFIMIFEFTFEAQNKIPCEPSSTSTDTSTSESASSTTSSASTTTHRLLNTGTTSTTVDHVEYNCGYRLDYNYAVKMDDTLKITIEVLAWIMISINCFMFLIWIYDKFPLYWRQIKIRYLKTHKAEELKLGDYLKIFLNSISHKIEEILPIVWNITLGILAASSKDDYWIFSIQLFIMYNLSITLTTMIQSIINRGKTILNILLLMLIITIIFSFIGFFELKDQFTVTVQNNYTAGTEVYCNSVIECLLTLLSYGIRSDGGIHEHLKHFSYANNLDGFIGRLFYDNIFFIVILLTLLMLFFSIIIDAFAQLREHTFHILEDKQNICFICGVERNILEKDGNSYEDHVEKDHNVWTYLSYMIGLKYVDIQDANSINSYVMECLEKKSLAWFPFNHLNEEESSGHHH